MRSANGSKAKEIITHAKTIPIAIYQLFFLNFVLFVGLVCRELSLIYIIGTFVFTCLFLVVLGRITNTFASPDQMVTLNIKYRLEQLHHKLIAYFNKLNLKRLQSDSINTIVGILLAIYIGSIVNSTLEIFLIINLIFLSVFLPQQTEGCIGVAKESLQRMLQKFKYNK